jgi:hypothetical protein
MKRGQNELMKNDSSILDRTQAPIALVAPAPITLAESKRLIELEKIIEAGQQTFVEVGIALTEIRDARLYKSDYSTFEEYCRKKWNFTRQYVNQIIAGTAAIKLLPAGLETIVSNISQARELVKVSKEKRVEVLHKASAQAKAVSRPVTARDIKVAASPTSEQDIRQRFRAATEKGSQGAWSWWHGRATPEKRGSFFQMILSFHKPVAVEDKEAFTKMVMRWLAEEVSGTGDGHE